MSTQPQQSPQHFSREELEYLLRDNQHTTMSLFSLYLDDITKALTLSRLRDLGIDTAKGSLSALIRTLLRYFALNEQIPSQAQLVTDIKKEYTFTTKKNKRSTL